MIGEDVLSGLARGLDALRPAAPTGPPSMDADRPAEPPPALTGYLAEATAHHPDIALHAVTLWDTAPAATDAAHGRQVPHHRLPAKASWRGFLRAMVALDSTSHPESSRRVYLDLVAALGRRRQAPVRWLRESVAGHAAAAARRRARGGTAGAAPRPPSSSGVNQIDLGSFNECVVIESVRLSGTITRGEIAHRTGLTQQSVSRIARSLLDRGILVEDAQRRATSGKPRTPVRLCGTAAHALGLHIDPEVLTAVVIDLDGAIVCTCTRPVSADTDPAEFVAQVVALGREALEKAQRLGAARTASSASAWRCRDRWTSPRARCSARR